VFGHIKGNRCFRRFSLRGLEKVNVEFGIVAIAHNILKVAGIRQLLSENNPGKKDKQVENRDSVSPLACIFHTILDTFQTTPFFVPAVCGNFWENAWS